MLAPRTGYYHLPLLLPRNVIRQRRSVPPPHPLSGETEFASYVHPADKQNPEKRASAYPAPGQKIGYDLLVRPESAQRCERRERADKLWLVIVVPIVTMRGIQWDPPVVFL